MLKRKSLLLLLILIGAVSSVCAQTSTVHFYRNKSLIMSNSGCMLIVNDTAKFSLTNGSYFTMTTGAESIDIVTSANNIGLKNLKLEKGKTYYIEIDPKNPTTVELLLRSEYMGKPALERIETDKLAAETSEADLKKVKVTSVSSMPEAEENSTKIYLFRPFNVMGISNMIKISDGECVYDMKNNSAHVISTDKKEITFVTLHEAIGSSNSSLTLKMEKGKVYYVAVLKSGGAIILSDSKEEFARKEMKQ